MRDSFVCVSLWGIPGDFIWSRVPWRLHWLSTELKCVRFVALRLFHLHSCPCDVTTARQLANHRPALASCLGVSVTSNGLLPGFVMNASLPAHTGHWDACDQDCLQSYTLSCDQDHIQSYNTILWWGLFIPMIAILWQAVFTPTHYPVTRTVFTSAHYPVTRTVFTPRHTIL